MPRLTGAGAPDARLGLGAADQAALLHGLDFWWAYALYAGAPAPPWCWRAALALAALTLAALAWLAAAWRAEARAG